MVKKRKVKPVRNKLRFSKNSKKNNVFGKVLLILVIIALVCVFSFFLAKLTGFVVIGVQATSISSCQVISSPGNYALSSDINGISTTCFNVTTDNVLIDGQGHTIRGTFFPNSTGVFLSGRRNVTITNFKIDGFDTGILAGGSSNSVFQNINLSNNVNGLTLYIHNFVYSANNVVSNIIAVNNTNGIYVMYSTNNTLSNITAYYNSYSGIFLSVTDNNRLTNITANYNYFGINLNQISSNTRLSNTQANYNTYTGIYLTTSSYGVLSNLIANNNTYAGVFLQSTSTEGNNISNISTNYNRFGLLLSLYPSFNTISDVQANYNIQDGVHLSQYVNFNNLSRIVTSYNNGSGVHLGASLNNSLSNITSTNNAVLGMSIYSSSFNTISGANLSSNWRGMHINWFSQGNNLSKITANNNSNYGIYIDREANGNVFSDITANKNYIGIYFDRVYNNFLSNIIVNNNTQGIYADQLTGNNSLFNVVANNNSDRGVFIFANAIDNRINNVTANYNYIGMTVYSSGNVLSNVTTRFNEHGLMFDSGANNNSLTKVNASNNNIVGILFSASFYNIVSNSVVNFNRIGIDTVFSSNNNLTNITLFGNWDPSYSVRLTGSTHRNIFYNMSVLRNASSLGTVFFMTSSQDNLFNRVTASFTSSDSHFIVESSNISVVGSSNINITVINSNLSLYSSNITIFNLFNATNLSVSSDSQVTYILTTCGTIRNPFSYKLMKNVNSSTTCFDIQSDNVILDGNGLSLDGDDTPFHHGVYVQGRNNVTIKNFINVSDFDYGIYVNRSSNVSVVNVSVYSNTAGVAMVRNIQNNRVSNVLARNNFVGIYVYYNANSTITNITAPSNSLGIYLEASSSNMIDNANVTGSSQGITFYNFSHYNTIYNSRLSANTNGIDLSSSNNNIINRTISILNNGRDLYQSIRPSENTTISDSVIRSYAISNSSRFTFLNSSLGTIEFKAAVNGTGINLFGESNSDISFPFRSAYINPNVIGLSRAANITLYFVGWKVTNPSILRNGMLCSNTTNPSCTIFYNAYGLFNFNVSSSGNHTINATFVNVCGDGVIDTDYGEVCDSTNFAGQTCSSFGNFNSGSLSCTNSCSQISSSACSFTSSGGGGGGGGAGKPTTATVNNTSSTNNTVNGNEDSQIDVNNEPIISSDENPDEFPESKKNAFVYSVVIFLVLVVIAGLSIAVVYFFRKGRKEQLLAKEVSSGNIFSSNNDASIN